MLASTKKKTVVARVPTMAARVQLPLFFLSFSGLRRGS
jgi:hypothetical protein